MQDGGLTSQFLLAGFCFGSMEKENSRLFRYLGVEFQVPVNSWMPAKQCPRVPKIPVRWRKLDPKIDFISDVLSSSDYAFGVFSPEYVTVKVTEIVLRRLLNGPVGRS